MKTNFSVLCSISANYMSQWLLKKLNCTRNDTLIIKITGLYVQVNVYIDINIEILKRCVIFMELS